MGKAIFETAMAQGSTLVPPSPAGWAHGTTMMRDPKIDDDATLEAKRQVFMSLPSSTREAMIAQCRIFEAENSLRQAKVYFHDQFSSRAGYIHPFDSVIVKPYILSIADLGTIERWHADAILAGIIGEGQQ